MRQKNVKLLPKAAQLVTDRARTCPRRPGPKAHALGHDATLLVSIYQVRGTHMTHPFLRSGRGGVLCQNREHPPKAVRLLGTLQAKREGQTGNQGAKGYLARSYLVQVVKNGARETVQTVSPKWVLVLSGLRKGPQRRRQGDHVKAGNTTLTFASFFKIFFPLSGIYGVLSIFYCTAMVTP